MSCLDAFIKVQEIWSAFYKNTGSGLFFFWRIINLWNSCSMRPACCCYFPHNLPPSHNEYLTASRGSLSFNSHKWFYISVLFSRFRCHSSSGIHAFLYSGSQMCCLPSRIPEASPAIILKENRWWMEGQTVARFNVCIVVFKMQEPFEGTYV